MSATIETMKISDVRSELNALVNRVYRGETRVLVEKSGIPVAALVSPEDLERLDRIERKTTEVPAKVRAEARREEAFEAMRQISRAFADVPIEELERQTELALMEARAQLLAERARAESAIE
jgi:prevent-host-death family protein